MSASGFAFDDALMVSTLRGSTTHQADRASDLLAWAISIKAKQHASGVQSGYRTKERSKRARSAILQAAGLEPMFAGPLAGLRRPELLLSVNKWPESVIAKIERNPRHYGLEKAPGLRLAQAVCAALRKQSTAEG